jgi:hypothetical protein
MTMRWTEELTRRARSLLLGLCLAAASTFFSLALLEVALRVGIDHLPILWANVLGTGYVWYGNGIYRYDPGLNTMRMRPNYEREMFFNGYHWLHRTDSMGFRNPQDRARVDIALIGDSMIYGQGLEEQSTVRSHLEHLLGRPVANLGEQGGAMDTEYQILVHDAVRLHPRYVFIFFLNNDITDVEERVHDNEIRRFLALPVSDHTTRYYDPRPRGVARDYPLRNLYVVRSYLLFKVMLKHRAAPYLARWHRSTAAAPAASARVVAATAAAAGVNDDGLLALDPAWKSQPPFAGDPRMQLALRFHLRAISKANDFARRHAMRFSYIFIAVPVPYDSLYEEINAEYCRTHGIDFFSLRPALEAAQRAGKQVYLPGDGHFSDAGAAITAQALADHFHLRDPGAWR